MPNLKPPHPFELEAMGARIAVARKLKGLSTQGLADRIGLSKGTVGHWETGKNAIKAPELGRLCELLDVSADELLFGIKRWPFEGIDFDSVHAMESDDKRRLEGAMIFAAGQLGIDVATNKANRSLNERAA